MRKLKAILHHLFVRNLGLKLFSIAVAAVLFLIAREETVREVDLEIPVVVTARPAGRVLMAQPPEAIQVRIQGNLQTLTDILVRRTPYELDLSGVEDNQTVFLTPETLAGHLGKGVRVLSVSPSSFTVRLDAVKRTRVPVAVNILKGPGHYFAVDPHKVQVVPAQVEVSGAATVVDQVLQVHTEPLDLTSVTKDFAGKVALEPREGVTVTPGSVQLYIPVEEKEGGKVVKGAKILVRDCPAGFSCQASPVFFQARVDGTQRVVDQVTLENLSQYVYLDGSKLGVEPETLQRQFPAVEPTIEPLKGGEISLPGIRYFNVTVTKQP